MAEKRLITGNEAVALGAWQAGVGLGTGYPGTPSTEITEFLATLPGPEVAWAVNEKVALEEAYGASVSGLRALVTMKHVGLNVAADPLFTLAYMGVNGGLVIAVSDDPGMHSSQNEQDTRWYALHAKVPLLEPADSRECLEMARLAFQLSEAHDLPFLLRLTTRVSHSRSPVQLEAEVYRRRVRDYRRDTEKFVVLPARARRRRLQLEENLAGLLRDGAARALNRMELTSSEVGIVTSGASYNYVKEAFGDRYSVLKIGLVYPLDQELVREFAARVDRVLVVEELEPYLEMQLLSLGIPCRGKELIPAVYELNPQIIASGLARAGLQPLESPEPALPREVAEIPARPPLLCAGCPHRGFFYLARRLGLKVVGDIGCYTLGGMPPLDALDASACMGGGFSIALGMSLNPPGGGKVFGVVGDSTFYHSGLTGAVEAVFNNRRAVLVVLDNRSTAMTGHQPNPGTGRRDGGSAAVQDPAALLRAFGLQPVLEVGAYDLAAIEEAINRVGEAEGAAAIVVKAPCRLNPGVRRGPLHRVKPELCHKCRKCLKLGCPAISLDDQGRAVIASESCSGCGLCLQVCAHQAVAVGEGEL